MLGMHESGTYLKFTQAGRGHGVAIGGFAALTEPLKKP
jgi:hypothetical protein